MINHPNRGNKPLHQAYENCKQARDKQIELSTKGKSRCMEVVEDKCGIVVERWLIGKTDAILFATPNWWNIYAPITDSQMTDATLASLEALANKY